ncbi:MAG: hypothetical protein A2Y38_09320 [Spirochaetes bacterium GWB1_59_5]|nr:MAG: hypothetical protein A2Y38_09320 [Spirochaetes bacterium GWB1_59_5]
MADSIEAARKYAAGEVIGRLVEPGDWVSIMRFYGKSEVVWQGDVTSQTDIATMVRSLNELKADGRYTDIGSALDSMDASLLERGRPERPKYILLLTDERQEAPKDSPYYSSTYTPHHRLLEYIKRVDMGAFRVITIGYGLSARIEVEARTLMTTLSEPPARPQEPMAGAAGSTTVQEVENAAPSQAEGSSTGVFPLPLPDSSPLTASSPNSGKPLGSDKAPDSSVDEAPGAVFSGALIAAALAAAAAIGIIIAVLVAKRKRRETARL